MKTTLVEVWVCVDKEETAKAGTDRDAVLTDMVGATRLVKVVLTVPVPEPVVVEATVGEEPVGVSVKVA
jgi:hypothetical protein